MFEIGSWRQNFLSSKHLPDFTKSKVPNAILTRFKQEIFIKKTTKITDDLQLSIKTSHYILANLVISFHLILLQRWNLSSEWLNTICKQGHLHLNHFARKDSVYPRVWEYVFGHMTISNDASHITSKPPLKSYLPENVASIYLILGSKPFSLALGIHFSPFPNLTSEWKQYKSSKNYHRIILKQSIESFSPYMHMDVR